MKTINDCIEKRRTRRETKMIEINEGEELSDLITHVQEQGLAEDIDITKVYISAKTQWKEKYGSNKQYLRAEYFGTGMYQVKEQEKLVYAFSQAWDVIDNKIVYMKMMPKVKENDRMVN